MSLEGVVKSLRNHAVSLAASTLMVLSPSVSLINSACSNGPVSCVADSQCENGGNCVDGFCDSCMVDSDCAHGKNCYDGRCKKPTQPEPQFDIQQDTFVPSKKVETVNVGGIPVNSGITNNEGRVDFWDSQSNESVPTYARKNGQPLSNAAIIFEDGDGFEVFHGDHNGEPYFHIFAHNSEKHLEWEYFKEVAVKFYDAVSNENNYEAAKRYAEHSKKNGQEIGCVLPNDIHLAQDERITAVIDLAELIPKIGSEAKKYLTYTKSYMIDKPYNIHKDLVEKGVIAADDCKAWQTWHTVDTFKKQNINVMAQAELYNYKCLTEIPKEICNDGKDNDCDQYVDANDPDCQETCKDECSPNGKAVCNNSFQFAVCGDYDSDDCLEWKIDYCPSGKECLNGKCIDSCSDECNSGSKTCVSDSTWKECGNYDSDKCVEWSSTKYCNNNQECKSGECVCKNECSSLEAKCTSSNTFKKCGNYDSDSCLEWSSDKECGSGYLCKDGACKPDCKDDCINGDKKCLDSKTVGICGNFDSDPCVEWGLKDKCPGGTYCNPGNTLCTINSTCSNECSSGEKKCDSGTSYKQCGDYDSDDCLEWSSAKSCSNGEICNGGKCETDSCSNDCSGGSIICIDKTSYKHCGQYDADGCFDWGPTYICIKGEECNNGKCGKPGPTCTDQCTGDGSNTCIDKKYYKTCGNYDSDSCLEWSNTKNCKPGLECIDGKCVDNKPQDRFIDLGDGTVKDNLTGRYWAKKHFKGKWTDSNQYCENLSLGGSSNWRLPSVSELEKVDLPFNSSELGWKCNGVPSGWASVFEENNCGNYWSYEDCGKINQKMCVVFNNGSQGNTCTPLDYNFPPKSRCIKK